MTSVLYFFMFWTFPLQLWSQNLGALVQWTIMMLPENFHAFLPKMLILLILNTYTLHRYLRIYKFEDKNI